MSNHPSSAGKPETYMRLCVPHVITFVFLLLNVSTLAFDWALALRPDFLLIAVYYWAVYRPTLMPPAIIFALGIIMDFLSGTPTGLFATTYITAHWITVDQRRFLMSQPFITLWLGFTVICLITSALQWLVYSLAETSMLAPGPLLLQAGSSAALFPLIVMLLFPVHRILPGGAPGEL